MFETYGIHQKWFVAIEQHDDKGKVFYLICSHKYYRVVEGFASAVSKTSVQVAGDEDSVDLVSTLPCFIFPNFFLHKLRDIQPKYWEFLLKFSFARSAEKCLILGSVLFSRVHWGFCFPLSSKVALLFLAESSLMNKFMTMNSTRIHIKSERDPRQSTNGQGHNLYVFGKHKPTLKNASETISYRFTKTGDLDRNCLTRLWALLFLAQEGVEDNVIGVQSCAGGYDHY